MSLHLRPINLLIGGNGAGKSNFVSFFKLVNAIFNQRLYNYVMEHKSDNILYFGRKQTEELKGKLVFSDEGKRNNNAYRFVLAQILNSELYIKEEAVGYNVLEYDDAKGYISSHGLAESAVSKSSYPRNKYIQKYINSLQVFHFHDTSPTSYLRRDCDLNDNLYLKQDGRNLPAFLYRLKVNHPKAFDRMFKTVQSVAPYIERFILEPKILNKDEIELRWVDASDVESSFSAYHLSDGTLRFIALSALLMQPEPPAVIIIDEPELGLHPFAIGKLAAMIKAASSITQVIVATQSPGLISHFEPEDIIVADKNEVEKQSTFQRLSSEGLAEWLKDFNLGELWERNIFNGAQPFRR